MASIFKNHESLILGELSKGSTFAEITRQLEVSGCKASRQALTDWLTRRAKRIKTRAVLNPGAPATTVVTATKPEVTRVIHAPKESPVDTENLDDYINSLIEKETSKAKFEGFTSLLNLKETK